jgi:uncharacterized membrane protein
LAELLGGDQVAVFVPTTPNITAGFFLVVPRAETIPLDMSVDDALKYIISMGVAEPTRKSIKLRQRSDPASPKCEPNTAATSTPVFSARP